MATKNRIEFFIDYEFSQKYPRRTVEDGVRWAQNMVSGTWAPELLQLLMRYGFSTEWELAMLNELIRLAKAGMPAHAQASTQT